MKPKTFWEQVLEEFKLAPHTLFICNASLLFKLEWEKSEEFRNYCFDMAEQYFPDVESGRALSARENILLCQITLFDVVSRDIRLDFLVKMVMISN